MAGKIANWLIDFCQMAIEDLETTSRLHMAAHELVENVLKYGSSPEIGLEFELERGDTRSIVRLRSDPILPISSGSDLRLSFG